MDVEGEEVLDELWWWWCVGWKHRSCAERQVSSGDGVREGHIFVTLVTLSQSRGNKSISPI